ncbi:MAG: hypothetical protein AAF765_02275 [Bacteroidota bacterium]
MIGKSKLTELERRIDEVLYYVWDPIGVSDLPHARGEYSSYTRTILNYVLKEDEHKIAEQLGKIESTSMGMEIKKEKNLMIAKRLLDFKDAVDRGIR